MSALFIGNQLPASLSSLGLPPLLHGDLTEHPLFRRVGWKLQPYTLAALFDTLRSGNHPEEARRAFWKWVLQNWQRIPVKLLPRLSELPIWPCRDGALRFLKELCLPRSSRVAAILADHIREPATEALSLGALKRRGSGRLTLRTQPSPDELAAYYTGKLASFELGRVLSDSEIARFRQFEEEIVALCNDHEIAAWFAGMKGIGLARDHTLKPVSDLHTNSLPVSSLELLDCDVIDRANPQLDGVFPAIAVPTTDAILRALRSDATRTQVLRSRLKAWTEAAQREKRLDNPIQDIECIPYEGRLVKPNQLAFKGNRGDFWGEWKLSLSGKGLSADEQHLYRLAGVTSGEPDADSSLAFFRWLGVQPQPALQRHSEQIIRHLAHPRSVQAWWEAHPDVPCLLVRIGDELRLVSRASAIRRNSHVCLPDFPELADAILAQPDKCRLMLVCHTHSRVTQPIAPLLREAGIQSLRSLAAAPLSVEGKEGADEPKLLQIIHQLCTSKRDSLRKRLAAMDLESSWLREHWYYRLQMITGVMTASTVRASFRVGGRTYWVDVVSGFDEDSRIIWVRRGRDREPENSLFEALVERVFQDGVPKYAGCVLQAAVHQEFHEHPLAVVPEQPQDVADEDGELKPDGGDIATEPGETSQTHHPVEPDASKNIPSPGPIPGDLRIAALRDIRPPHSGTRTEHTSRRPSPELESVQRMDLKQNQYAWHCQACLAAKPPAELAPAGSYVEFAENRQKLIDAHHADQVHAGGARSAGNLVVLCYYHHHRFGNALSRTQIAQALSDGATPKRVSYLSCSDGQRVKRDVDGYVVSINLTGSGDTAELFFTDAHRDIWLKDGKKAEDRGGPAGD